MILYVSKTGSLFGCFHTHLTLLGIPGPPPFQNPVSAPVMFIIIITLGPLEWHMDHEIKKDISFQNMYGIS